jgi:hypothetical protein
MTEQRTADELIAEITDHKFKEKFSPLDGARFASRLLKYLLTNCFADIDLSEFHQGVSAEDGNEHIRQKQIVQLELLYKLGEIFSNINKHILNKDLIEAVYVHDISAELTHISGSAQTLMRILNNQNLLQMISYDDIVFFLHDIQQGIEEIALLDMGFNIEKSEIVLFPQQLSKVAEYAQRFTMAKGKNSKLWTEERRLDELAFMSWEEKQRAFLEGTLADTQLEHLNQHYPQIKVSEIYQAPLEKTDLQPLIIPLNTPAFVRIFANVLTNTKKAYQVLLEKHNFSADLDPLLRITIKYVKNGVLIVFEDQAIGYPIQEGLQRVVSEFDGAVCAEYIPGTGETFWDSSYVGGTGTGIAGFVKTIQSVSGAYLRCLTPLDEDDNPGGARTELFLPTTVRFPE